jgi:hypothetical protein
VLYGNDFAIVERCIVEDCGTAFAAECFEAFERIASELGECCGHRNPFSRV